MQLAKPCPLQCRPAMMPLMAVTLLLVVLISSALLCSPSKDDAWLWLPLGQAARPPAALPSPITLQLTDDGRLLVNGAAIRPAELQTALRQPRESLRLPNPADAAVILRADPHVATGKVQELMEICQELGFQRVTLK
jgi:biopolymer transport protein ExbD